MNFGKLPDISNVDFSLPPDPPIVADVLQKNRRVDEAPLQFYIGATGWGMKEWVGTYYPADAKAKNYLHYYAAQFNTIELNTTHYRIPSIAIVQKWYAETAPDFRFCPKIPQTISHSANLGAGSNQIELFCAAISHLQEKLGCCFMQLPPYFGADRLPVLEQFLADFPTEIPLAVEVRHESWFARTEAAEQLFSTLESHGITTVITDVSGRRDVLHMYLTTGVAMIRFVGNGLHPSDYIRIDEWVQRLDHWKQQGLAAAYFFTHEPDNIDAPQLAQYLCEKLSAYKDISVRGPKRLIPSSSGQQIILF